MSSSSSSQKPSKGQLPTTKQELSLNTTGEHPFAPKCQKDFVAMASVRAPLYEPSGRVPVDLICVIDTSGSMAGGRISLVLQTLHLIIDNLRECDTLTIVNFSNKASTCLAHSKMSASGKALAKTSVQRLSAYGGTNLSDGLMKGVGEVFKAGLEKQNEVCTILLFTDGQANAGLTDARAIMKEVRKEVYGQTEKAELPFTINTFGFGSNHNVDLLKLIAEQGHGSYYYIERQDRIMDSFGDCLGGILSTFAKKITMKIYLQDGISMNKILSDYPTKLIDREGVKKHHVLTLGDIQSEESRDIVFDAHLPHVEHEVKEYTVAKVVVDYRCCATKEIQTVESDLKIARVANYEPGDRNMKVDGEYNRCIVANAMQEATRFADIGDLERARKIIAETESIIKTSVSRDKEFTKGLLKDLRKTYDDLKSKDYYREVGSKSSKSRYLSHKHQRMNDFQNCAQMQYSTSSRLDMQMQVKQRQQSQQQTQQAQQAFQVQPFPRVSAFLDGFNQPQLAPPQIQRLSPQQMPRVITPMQQRAPINPFGQGVPHQLHNQPQQQNPNPQGVPPPNPNPQGVPPPVRRSGSSSAGYGPFRMARRERDKPY